MILATLDETLSYSIPNNGTASCPCKITATMTGAEDGLKITLLETGGFIFLDTLLHEGSVVEIDTNKEEVTINGIDVRQYVYFASVFFNLQPGENTLTASGGEPLEVTFREKFR